MGNTKDAAGKPIYNTTPQTVPDFQASVDYAEAVGGLLKLTAAERQLLSAGQTYPGWLLSETDTRRVFLRTNDAPQGVLVAGNLPVCKAKRATATATHPTPGQFTTILFDAEAFDNADMHSTTVQPSRVVAPYDGRYKITYQFATSNGTGNAAGRVLRNGAPVDESNASAAGTSGWFPRVFHSVDLVLTAGNYIELQVMHTAAASVEVPVSSLFLLVEYVAPAV